MLIEAAKNVLHKINVLQEKSNKTYPGAGIPLGSGICPGNAMGGICGAP